MENVSAFHPKGIFFWIKLKKNNARVIVNKVFKFFSGSQINEQIVFNQTLTISVTMIVLTSNMKISKLHYHNQNPRKLCQRNVENHQALVEKERAKLNQNRII